MAFLKMTDGAQIYYEDEGRGQPILMVHGWKASADVYAQTSRCLQDEFRCIRYDQCGHMRSSAPKTDVKIRDLGAHLHRFVTALCGEKPVLVGWSMGAATVMDYIRQYGCNAIRGVVLVDYPPRMRNNDTWKFGRDDGTMTDEMKLIDRDFHAFLYVYYLRTNVDFPDMSEAERLQMIDERMQGHDPKILASLWKDINWQDFRDVLPAITVPTAIFYADKKPVCSQGAAEYYARTIPGSAKLVKFEGASHALISEQPDRFAQELRTFIREVQAKP